MLYPIQILRHGAPRRTRCDFEYDNTQFFQLCQHENMQPVFVPANDHEAYGLDEDVNRTLCSFFDRIRSREKRSTVNTIVTDFLFGKNISLGSKTTSALDMLYGCQPRLLSPLDDTLPRPLSIQSIAQATAAQTWYYAEKPRPSSRLH